MHDGQIGLGRLQLLHVQDVAVLEADVILLVEEPLPLHARHVQDVQLGHGILQGLRLLPAGARRVHLLLHVVRNLQLLRRDEDEADILVAEHGLDEGVDGAPEFQVPTETDGHVGQASLLALDGQQVRQGLGRMKMPAVAGIDDRHGGSLRRHDGRALLGMPHGDDVHIAADRADGIADAFALGGGAGGGLGKAQHAAPELQHGGLEAQAGAGARLEEQGRQLLVGADVFIGRVVRDDVIGHLDEVVDLLDAQIRDVDEVSDFLHSIRPP